MSKFIEFENPYSNEIAKYEITDYVIKLVISHNNEKRESLCDRRFLGNDKSEVIRLINENIRKGFLLINYKI